MAVVQVEKVRKSLTSGASTMIIESGCVFHTGEKRRRKNTFIKIARDHRNALYVYGRVQGKEGNRGLFDRMVERWVLPFFFSFHFFPCDKMERLT